MSNISFLVPNITSVNFILKIQWGTITGFKAREKCGKNLYFRKLHLTSLWQEARSKKAQEGLVGEKGIMAEMNRVC